MGDEQNKYGLSPVDARVNEILSASSPKFLADGLGLRGTPTLGLTAPAIPSPTSGEMVSFSEPSSSGFQLGGGFDFSFPDARGGGGGSFPFWDWSKIQTNSDAENPEYAYTIWFGKPKADSVRPSEVYTLSLFTSVEDEGITLDGTDIPRVTAFMADGAYANLGADGKLSLRNSESQELHLNPIELTFVDGSSYVTHSGTQLYGQYGGISPQYDDDGNLVNAGNGGNNFLLKPDSDGVSLTLSDTTGSSLFATQDEVTVTDSSGSWASLLSSGSLELQDSDGNHFTLYPYALTLTNSAGDSGTYEPHQLTISHGGDESYLSTSALRILTQTGDGTYEAHQATLRDQNGGVDLNTAEIKTYQSNGAYAAMGSAGTLSLRNSGGIQLDLEATQISFSAQGKSSTLDAYGLEVSDGSNKADVSVAQVETSDSNGRSRLKPTVLQIIEGANKTGTYEAHQATLRDQNGGVDLSAEEIKTYKPSGAYAALGSDGTLSLRNSSGTQLDLEATQISFSAQGKSSTLDAYGLEVSDGSNKADVSVAQVETSDSNGRSRLKPTVLQIIEGTNTGTYEALQLTLGSSSGKQLFASPDNLYLRQSSSGQQFRADTAGWTVENSARTSYTTASSSRIYTENPTAGNAKMDPAGFSVAKGSDFAAMARSGLTVKDSTNKTASVGPNWIEVQGGNNKGTFSNAGLTVRSSSSWSALNGVGSLQLSDGSGTAVISQNSLYLTDGSKYINMDVAGLGGKDAYWQTITVCVDGVDKTMKVLGTTPA